MVFSHVCVILVRVIKIMSITEEARMINDMHFFNKKKGIFVI